MPRSNKPKKNCATLRPPPKPNVSKILDSEKQLPTLTPRPTPSLTSSMHKHKQPSTHEAHSTIQTQKPIEVMISRAISSAKKHEIDVHQGRPISRDGNCAIESVIANINERQCFSDSFNFTPDYYRRIWVTDFKNRTINDKNWNIYTNQEWEQGWAEMMKSGVYERGLFGDLMLFAVACGVRKTLLVINTNLDSPHDPIYICDPAKFNVEPSTNIPVVLAYDMSHYESLHPSANSDIEKTIELVQQYQAGNYPFSHADLPFLLNTPLDMNENANSKALEETYQCEVEDRTLGAQVFEKSLPEHLRGKRPKEMNPDEKKIYNNIRRKFSRLNECPKTADDRKQKDAEAKSTFRATENEEEKVKKKSKNTEARSSKRAKETLLERAERNEAKRRANAKKKETETDKERAERNEARRKAYAKKKETETDKEKADKKETKRKENAKIKETQTDEERAERNEAKRKANAKKRETETDEEAARRKQQRAIQREQKIPKSLYDARNGQKVLLGEQIVPELLSTKDSIGDMNIVCEFCNARKWKGESATLCCNSGKVILPVFPAPPDLLKELLTDNTEEAKLFRKNARTFNNALALSSVKVNIKKFTGGFAPCVVFEGKVHQKIGPLLPEDG